MNAASLYVTTSRLIVQAKSEDPTSWIDLFRTFNYLRQSLSCTVCGNLLMEPYTPTETTCQHHVCRNCKGGKKKLKPSCSWCKDYTKYVENVQLRLLLQCYKKLCLYFSTTALFKQFTTGVLPNNSTNTNNLTVENVRHLVELLKEGSNFKDDYKPISKPLIGQKNPHSPTKSAHNDKEGERLKLNGKSPTYSVICTDNGNRLTFKRQPKGALDKRKISSKDKRRKKKRLHRDDKITSVAPEKKKRPLPKDRSRSLQRIKKPSARIPDKMKKLKKKSVKEITKQKQEKKTRSRTEDRSPVKNEKKKTAASQEDGENKAKTRRRTVTRSQKADIRSRKIKRLEKSKKTDLTVRKKRSAHEVIPSTKINKVRKRSVFTKPPQCKCGVLAPNKGSCRGYRCPCYSADKSCLDCSCLGCKNPRGASLNKAPPESTAEPQKLKEEQFVKEKV